MFLPAATNSIALISTLICCWQWAAARRFPIHQRILGPAYFPNVTILKPLRGADAFTRDSLESWFDPTYPGKLQILFGVHSTEDPAYGVATRLIQAHPNIHAQVIVCPEGLGPNGKVSTLVQLSRSIAHDVVIVSDADVRVPPQFLPQLVAPLAHPEVGLVNCLYRFGNPINLPMQWEALSVNADFWSQVLQSRSLQPQNFALGAVMALPTSLLRSIGGFETVLNYLADDFQLGRHVFKTGARIELCPIVVDCFEPVSGWTAVWRHQVRWARTLRICQPLPYFASIISHTQLWCLIALLSQTLPAFQSIAIGLWLLRSLILLDLLRRIRAPRIGPIEIVLSLFKDLTATAVWFTAFIGATVTWRGQRFRVQRGGRFSPC